MKNTRGFNLVTVLVIVLLTSIASAVTVGVIINNTYRGNTGLTYKEILDDKSLSDFLEVYSDISSKYYEEINKDEMLNAATEAMLKYLGDDYTTYMTKEESSALEQRLAGTYEGVGIAITGRKIVKVTDDSPAKEAGLQVGDEIIKVNDIDVSDYTSSQISILIKASGKNGVELTVLREDKELTFKLNLATLINADISYALLDDNIGYLQMSVFSKTLATQVASALKEMEDAGMQKLIIDLRNNTGGYLEVAEAVANQFLKNGKLIYSLENKDKKEDYYDKTDEAKDYRIVIIQNSNTASAAEVLIAALKDSCGAIIVGTTSYGKGKVQQTSDLSDGAMAKYTTARWLRPNGDCIDGVGIEPDFKVELEYRKDDNGIEIAAIDTQFQKALEIISAIE